MTTLLKTIPDLESWRTGLDAGSTIGFTPTLGGLHEGHLSLIRRSQEENDISVVSIFLNRVQFNNPGDISTYPAIFEEDLSLLRDQQVDAVFAPDYESLYPDEYRYRVMETTESARLEGAHRPGHFAGVLTVVLKLLNLVRPAHAYFGEKDYQQLELIRGMVSAFFVPTRIVACPTVRDERGLALSSRNRRLSQEARERAAEFPRILRTADSPDQAERELIAAGFEVDYVEEHNGRRLAAVTINGVRLIDNQIMENSSSASAGGS